MTALLDDLVDSETWERRLFAQIQHAQQLPDV
jgi:hypothetical protein